MCVSAPLDPEPHEDKDVPWHSVRSLCSVVNRPPGQGGGKVPGAPTSPDARTALRKGEVGRGVTPWVGRVNMTGEIEGEET